MKRSNRSNQNGQSGFSRRELLQHGLCTAGGIAGLHMISNLGLIGAAAAQGGGGGGYKALVCVYLGGGNDSFNLLVPHDNAHYGVYATTRQGLAVAQNALLPITPLTSDGAQYGLHPSCTELQSLFGAGKLDLPVSAAGHADAGLLLARQFVLRFDRLALQVGQAGLRHALRLSRQVRTERWLALAPVRLAVVQLRLEAVAARKALQVEQRRLLPRQRRAGRRGGRGGDGSDRRGHRASRRIRRAGAKNARDGQ